MKKRKVVVYGPQGCGKTRNAEELMSRYGCTAVRDEWDGEQPLPAGTLALTTQPPPYGVHVDAVVPFDLARVTV